VHWPDARIVVAVNRQFAPLLEAEPSLDGLIIREMTRRVRRLITLRQAACSGIRNRYPRFDLAIDLQGNFHSAAWTYLSGARAMAGFGGRRRGWQFSVPISHARHAVDENASIVERLGVSVPDRRPRLHVSSSDEEFIADFLRKRRLRERSFIVVHPFTAWRSKEWPLERYAAVLRPTLARHSDLRVLITGSSAEAARARGLAELIGHAGVMSVAGMLTLGQSLALWSRARLCLGGDTGALHASAAFGVRVLALFGPTLPEVSGPIGEGHRVVQASRPATQNAYRQPGAERHMMDITVTMVHDALDVALQ
jgi:ADP-heptose:LPS heptosyltransferase